MQAINYVKKSNGSRVLELTPSGKNLANLALAANGGVRGTYDVLVKLDSKVSQDALTRIVNNGKKGAFNFSSWERFFNALILKQPAKVA